MEDRSNIIKEAIEYWKQLEKENAELKDDIKELGSIIECKNGTIATLAKTRDKLKAENARLKEEINKLGKKHEDYCNIMYWQMKEQIDKYLGCLQEIKDIAEKEIYMKQNSSMNKIIDLITKAEEE